MHVDAHNASSGEPPEVAAGLDQRKKAHMSTSRPTIERRDFVKASAAGVVTASLGIAAVPASAAEEQPSDDQTRWLSEAGKTWRMRPEPIDESLIADGGAYDVIVIGGGQAGSWAARSAAMNGASVIVLEAQKEENFLYVGGQVGAINSQWAIEHGAQVVDTNDLMNELVRRNAARCNPKLMRQYVEHSGAYLDWALSQVDPAWLEENAHVISADRTENMVMDPSGYKYYASTVIFRHKDETRGGAVWMWGPGVVAVHRQKAIEEDGAVWMWNTRAELIETNEEGRATSVLATSDDGASYFRVKANKGVIIAAGDFGGNRDMLLDINDEYRHLAESLGDMTLATAGSNMGYRQGWGIRLGIWAGGHIEVGPHAGMNTGIAGPIGTNKAPWGPGMPLLNKRGERFCDECASGAEGSGYLVPRQPRGVVVAVCDANWADVAERMPPCHESVDWTHGVRFQLSIDVLKEKMDAVEYGVNDNGIIKADTLEELFALIADFDDEARATAVAEIEKYNGFAVNGNDEDYAVDPRIMKPLDTPPFYAYTAKSDAIGNGLVQVTGLDIDAHHRVLNSQLEPIPGLFAIGNSSGNRFLINYCTPVSGMSLAYALTEGMQCGEFVAKS